MSIPFKKGSDSLKKSIYINSMAFVMWLLQQFGAQDVETHEDIIGVTLSANIKKPNGFYKVRITQFSENKFQVLSVLREHERLVFARFCNLAGLANTVHQATTFRVEQQHVAGVREIIIWEPDVPNANDLGCTPTPPRKEVFNH